MSSLMHSKEVFVFYETMPFTPKHERLTKTFLPLDLLNLLLDHGVIAGGFALSLFLPECKPSDIDIFVLNGDRGKFISLIKSIQTYFPDATWSIHGSVV